MFRRMRTACDRDEAGFTLVELLIVMIITGILAAIAIPAFVSQKSKARETSAKADAGNIGKQLASALVDGRFVAKPTLNPVRRKANTYSLTTKTTADGTGSTTIEVRVSPGNKPAMKAPTTATAAKPATTYCVSVTPAAGTGKAWSAGDMGLFKSSTCS